MPRKMPWLKKGFGRLDPVFLIPVIVVAAAGGFLVFNWREGATSVVTPHPTSTLAPSDPDSAALLKDMEQAMNGLSSLKAVQILTDDSGHSLTTTLLYSTPNRVYLRTSTGEESIVIGGQQWERGPNEAIWKPIQRAQPFAFPDFHEYGPVAVEVKPGGDSLLNGRPTKSVTFSILTSTGPIRFEAFADPGSLRFQRITMEAPGHHMVTDYVDYNPSILITPPPDKGAAPAATP